MPEAQNDPVPAVADGNSATTSTTTDQASSGDGTTEIVPPLPGEGGGGDGVVEPVALPTNKGPLLGPAGIGLLVVVGLSGLYVAAVLGGRRARRARRLKSARTPAALVAARWQDAVEDLGVLGLRTEPSETPTEFATRAARRAPLEGTGFGELAHITTAAWYSDGQLDDGVTQQASSTATAVMERVREQTSTGQRLNYELSPRQQFTRWRSHRQRRP